MLFDIRAQMEGRDHRDRDRGRGHGRENATSLELTVNRTLSLDDP